MGDTGGIEPRGERSPEIRIADADRDRVIAVLRTACGEGRLTLDEFAERAGIVYAASTSTELEAVLVDLPASTTTNPQTRQARRSIVAVMSGAKRRGRWRVAPHTTAVAVWGGIQLDFRGAVVESPVVDLTAWAVMGGIDITVPDGIPVELSGGVFMGGTVNRVKDLPVVHGAPLLRIRVRGLWGGVTVRSRPIDGKPRRPRSRRGELPDPSAAALPPRPVYAERPPDPEISTLAQDVRGGPFELAADGTVTILFSDIEGSTELADRLGDHRWLDVLREHNKVVREQIAIAGGREVKAQGDGFMVTFPGVSRALRCAIEIQRALSTWRENHPDTPVYVRIGVHTGEVLADGGDIYGKHVMIAARVASQARGGEVLASSLVRELADGAGIQFGAGRDVELRGLDRPWRLYPVDWTPD